MCFRNEHQYVIFFFPRVGLKMSGVEWSSVLLLLWVGKVNTYRIGVGIADVTEPSVGISFVSSSDYFQFQRAKFGFTLDTLRQQGTKRLKYNFEAHILQVSFNLIEFTFILVRC